MKLINVKKPLTISAKTFHYVVITYRPAERYYLSIFLSLVVPLTRLNPIFFPIG